MTKLSPTLPKGPGNGLETLARHLITYPHQTHTIIAVIDCKTITTDSDDGTTEATARIRWVEAITDRADRKQAEAAMRRAAADRTGDTTLPFDDDTTDTTDAIDFVEIDPAEIL